MAAFSTFSNATSRSEDKHFLDHPHKATTYRWLYFHFTVASAQIHQQQGLTMLTLAAFLYIAQPLSAFECHALKESITPPSARHFAVDNEVSTQTLCDHRAVYVTITTPKNDHHHQAQYKLMKFAKETMQQTCDRELKKIDFTFELIPKTAREGTNQGHVFEISTNDCDTIDSLIEEEAKALTEIEFSRCIEFNENNSYIHKRMRGITEDTIDIECGTNRAATIHDKFTLRDLWFTSRKYHEEDKPDDSGFRFKNKNMVTKFCNDLKDNEELAAKLKEFGVTRYGIITQVNSRYKKSGHVDIVDCE
ncbi:hypothetical protein [Vibrio owensii]|uniref:hypothetical protein n=1 Tax=Vibrio owensii TaxID=696485 RepID=UPI0018F1C7AE|nr:hypothetical protein [Vibrio owensii]